MKLWKDSKYKGIKLVLLISIVSYLVIIFRSNTIRIRSCNIDGVNSWHTFVNPVSHWYCWFPVEDFIASINKCLIAFGYCFVQVWCCCQRHTIVRNTVRVSLAYRPSKTCSPINGSRIQIVRSWMGAGYNIN